MDTSTTQFLPLTKWAARQRNDIRAHSRYARRRDIDAWHEERRLDKQLREPLT